MKLKHLITGMALTSASAVLLSGCSAPNQIGSPKYSEYERDHSMAWNLAHSAGMRDMTDTVVPHDQVTSGMEDLIGVAIDTGYFMNSARFAMNFTDAFGLSLLGTLTDNPGHGERNRLIAWVPDTEADDREEAYDWVMDSVRESSLAALQSFGVEDPVVEFHDRREDPWGAEEYGESRYSGVKADGIECVVYVKNYPTLISEKRNIPRFIKPNAQGYQVYGGERREVVSVSPFCTDETGDDGMAFIAEVSEHLPDTMYLYQVDAGYPGDDDYIPPRVYDHGKIHLFLTVSDEK